MKRDYVTALALFRKELTNRVTAAVVTEPGPGSERARETGNNRFSQRASFI